MERSKLVSALCFLEGKKSQVKAGDMSEVVACLEKYTAQRHFDEGLKKVKAKGPVFDGIAARAQARLDKLWKKAKKG